MQAEKSGKSSIQHFFRDKNLWARLLSLLGAFVIWFYVISVDSPGAEKEFKDIDIDLMNVSEMTEAYGISVLNGYGVKCDLTLYGKKSELNKLKTSEISAYVDLVNVDGAGNYELDVIAKTPNGITVSSVYPSKITVFVDRTSTKNVPVNVISSYTKDKDIVIDTPKLNYNSITITGPLTEIEDIAEARLTVDLGNVTKSVEASGKIVLMNKDGAVVSNPYIKTNVTDVIASFSVYKYKSLPIKVNTKYGILDDGGIDIEMSPSAVRVRGEPASIDAIDEYIIATIDEKQITDNEKSYVFTINLPSGIEKVDDVDSVKVNATLIDNSTRSLAISLNSSSAVKVLPPVSNRTYTFKTPVINIRIRGESVAVALASIYDLNIVVDLSRLVEAGSYSVPVTVEFANETKAYVVGEYTAEVDLL